MLTEEGPGSGAPVIALIVDQLFETIKKAVRPMPNGRLNPPVRIILDEAGNICRAAADAGCPQAAESRSCNASPTPC
jgi:hypothetical protein